MHIRQIAVLVVLVTTTLTSNTALATSDEEVGHSRERLERAVNAKREKMFSDIMKLYADESTVELTVDFIDRPVVYEPLDSDDPLFVAFAELLQSGKPNIVVMSVSVRLHVDKIIIHAQTRAEEDCYEVALGWRDGNSRMETRLVRCSSFNRMQ